MRRSILALLALALFACEEMPPPAPPPQPTAEAPAPPSAAPAAPAPRAPKAPVALEEYLNTRRLGAAHLTFDEKNVVYVSDAGGRPDLWVMPVGGGAARQLTHVSGFLLSFEPSPTKDQIVFEADKGGDELPHLYLTNLAGEAPKDLVADYPAGRRTQFIQWSDDGKKLYFLSNARDERAMDLIEYDLAKGKAETLWKASGKLSVAALSHDVQRWAVVETISDADSNLYLVERGKADKPVLLTKHEGEVTYDAKTFSRDGKTLYYTSDEGREFAALFAMDLGKKTSKALLSPDADVENAGFSRSHRHFWTEANVDGTPRVVVTDTKTGKEVKLPAAPNGGAFTPYAFSKSERWLTARLHTDTRPPAPYVIDLEKGTATPLADPLPEALRGRAMVAGESIRIPSFDGKPVPAFLYKPQGDGPFPAIIDVHGGPTAQSRREYAGLRQYLVSKGYVVLVPNVRGSTGYGKTYTKLDNLDLGGGPLQDVVACKRWMVQNAKVAADKVVVVGGSYGGYMALSAATFTPNEFVANVDFFGVSDLKSLVESFPPYWAAFATYIYKKFGDPKNPAHAQYQHDRSPLYFVDKMERPLLVVQGDKDSRVKKDQSDRMVEAIRKKGIPVHYMVLENEGHGFSRNESYLRAFQVTDRFLDRYVFGDTSVEVLPGEKK
jgi:dipeptidyl aminopeptidase/acylaminoacyl peptidase